MSVNCITVYTVYASFNSGACLVCSRPNSWASVQLKVRRYDSCWLVVCVCCIRVLARIKKKSAFT